MRPSIRIILFLQLLVVTRAADKPLWFENPPTDDQYYHAVVKQSTEESDYINRADNTALEQISKQIYIDIYSESKRTIDEIDDIAKKRYESFGTAVSIAEISGAEKQPPYEDRKYYYVYWRLDKRKHQENIEKYNKEYF